MTKVATIFIKEEQQNWRNQAVPPLSFFLFPFPFCAQKRKGKK
jgi:hypothetical protein